MSFMEIFKPKPLPPAMQEPAPVPTQETPAGNDRSLEVFTHPFQRGAMDNAWIWIRKPSYPKDAPIEFSATLEFKHGKASGKQEINGNSLQDVVNKINRFLEGL